MTHLKGGVMTQSKYINIISKAVIACVVALGVQTTAFAAEPKNRIFFRGGFAQLEDNRQGQTIVDDFFLIEQMHKVASYQSTLHCSHK